jgi:hypothetical protein
MNDSRLSFTGVPNSSMIAPQPRAPRACTWPDAAESPVVPAVDDERSILAWRRQSLREFGYAVLPAGDVLPHLGDTVG